MDRIDLYTAAHKGLRTALFHAVRRVARTDFAADAGADAAAAAVADVLRFLSEYAAHDEAVLLPEIAALCTGLAASLRSDRARLRGLEQRCAGYAARLAGAAGVARIAIGRRLHASLTLLAAEHLVHMDRLETQANRLLWAHRTDGELRALEARIVARMPAERLAAWLALVLPACCSSERTAILDGMRAGLPGAASAAAPLDAAIARDQ